MDKNKYKKINHVINEIENVEIETIDEQINVPVEIKRLTVRVINHANVRPYPNHTSTKLKMLKDGAEVEVLDVVEGSLVQGGNTWYKIEGGFIHFSQAKEV